MELKNFDRLVQSITSSILEKLELKPEHSKNDKSCLILLPNIGFGMKDYYAYISSEFPGYNLYVGKDNSSSNTQYGSNNLIKYVDIDLKSNDFIDILDNVELIFVIGLKISQMKALIHVDDTDVVNHVILGSLMVNKKVTMILNSNNEMHQKISHILNDIASMGIEVVNIQKQVQSNNKTSIQANELITEDYVKDLYKNGSRVIVMSKKQLITPLAKDKLRELKIEVKYVKEDNL